MRLKSLLPGIVLCRMADKSKWISAYSAFILILMLISCSPGNNPTDSEITTFNFADFQEIDLSASEEIITDDADLLGIVRGIAVVNDSIIAICQNSADSHVVLYNLKSGEKQIAIKRGEGPTEMLSVTSLSTDKDGCLWISGLMDKKIMTSRWNDDGDNAISELKYRSCEDLLRGVSDGNGGILGLPAVTRKLKKQMP